MDKNHVCSATDKKTGLPCTRPVRCRGLCASHYAGACQRKELAPRDRPLMARLAGTRTYIFILQAMEQAAAEQDIPFYGQHQKALEFWFYNKFMPEHMGWEPVQVGVVKHD